jgi:acetoin utilization deacetylase AcuC-like enzyme
VGVIGGVDSVRWVPTAFAYDERCLAHDNGSMLSDERAASWLDVAHVEQPARLVRTMEVLTQAGVLDDLTRVESRQATRDELELVHTSRLIDAIEAACAKHEHAWIGPEARVGPDSWEPALMAAGNTLQVVDAVLKGETDNGFALVRPPGHHSSQDEAMGFCLFNNVAIAARHAQQTHGLKKVAIVDWDVHHGNGTEMIFWDDPSVLFVSLHQDDLYPPGRGGLDAQQPTTVNIPLPAGTGDAGYLAAWDELVAPRLEAFEPELLLISAGQDAAAADPLGRMSVTTEGFRQLTARAMKTETKLAVVLEGGYSLDHLPFCNLAIVEELAGLEPSFASDPLELDVPHRLREFERVAIGACLARWRGSSEETMKGTDG